MDVESCRAVESGLYTDAWGSEGSECLTHGRDYPSPCSVSKDWGCNLNGGSRDTTFLPVCAANSLIGFNLEDSKRVLSWSILFLPHERLEGWDRGVEIISEISE